MTNSLPPDIIARVRQDFGEDDGLLALQELKNLQSEDAQLFCDRILRCIVALARGSLKKLAQEIQATRLDPRDVMVAAEGWACNAHLMDYPFPAQLDEALCRSWIAGQSFRLPWAKEGDAFWRVEAGDIRELELRQIKSEPSEGSRPGAEIHRALIRMLCIRGQPISLSPAFETWLLVWYGIDPEARTAALERIVYDPKHTKQMGKWD